MKLPLTTSRGEPLTPEELAAHPSDSHCTRTRLGRLYACLTDLVLAADDDVLVDAVQQLARAYGREVVVDMLNVVLADLLEDS